MNSFGHNIRFTSFGESHGACVGGVLDGFPSGITIDEQALHAALSRRRRAEAVTSDGTVIPLPGTSARAVAEEDRVEWLGGVTDGVTNGAPVAFMIRNIDARPQDYADMPFRAGHGDKTWFDKYGVRLTGGGRLSARETVARVVAGVLVRQLPLMRDIKITARLTEVGGETDPRLFADVIRAAASDGDSVGGIVTCTISGVPAGVGEPLFDKMQSRLAAAMLSIPACKGFEYGLGFEAARVRGSVNNMHSGGILGGITDGNDITFRCAFKPTPSIGVGVRHDACVAARAAAVVEAMTALVIADFLIPNNSL